MKQILRSALILALAAASGTAAALGLGQIQVKSKLGQPLLAEIPIITNDPAELEALQARQPAAEVFERVGIQPPTGVAATLQYAYAVDARGNPVIRITTSEPVSEPLLTFVVEVDWASGRLVREYSALVDTPAAVATAAQPSVEMPTVSPPNVIERPVVEDPVLEAIAQTPVPMPVPEAPEPEPELVVAEESALPGDAIAATPMPAPLPQPELRPEPQPTAAVPEPAPPARAAPVEREAETPVAATQRPNELRVEQGQTLSEIAGQLGAASRDQAMVALLRANPDAFIRGNINELKAGAVLRVPDSDATAAVELADAQALVRAQMQEWRQHRSVRQPDVTDSALATADDAGNGAAQASRSARLEIVPPGASKSKKAGNQSGIETGGEGQMLRQELQETKETLAARDAEVEELKSRLGELEQLQADQQQLISMKDSELAAAQKRLAEGPSKSQEAAKTAEAQADGGGMMPWIAGSGALVFLALLGAWLLRRRSGGRQPDFRAPSANVARRPSIADSVAIPPRAPVSEEPFAEQAMQGARAQVMARARAEADVGEYGPIPTAMPQSPPHSHSQTGRDESARPHSEPQQAQGQAREEPMFEQAEPLRAVGSGPVVAQVSMGGEAVQLPFWDRRQRQPMPSGRAQPPNLRSVPTSSPTPTVQAPVMGAASQSQVVSTPSSSVPPPWHGAGAGNQQWHEPVAAPTVESGGGAGHDRLELAQAYLDLGDDSSARQLLVEVAANGDASARQKAARMLLDLEQG